MKLQTGTVKIFSEELGIGRIKPDDGGHQILFFRKQGRRVEINGNGQLARFVGTTAGQSPKPGDKVGEKCPAQWTFLPKNPPKKKRNDRGKSDRHCLMAAGHRI